MAYLGRPASPDVSVTGSTDTFTGNGGTTFTLSRPVKDSNASLLEVFVSNVQQQPSVTYSVASTTLTFVTAPGVGEPIYVTYRDYNVAPVFTVPDGAISEGKIQPDAVTESKIGTGAVTETKIGAGAVVEGKLAANAVTEAKIADGAVVEGKLAANAITEAKIASNAVTSTQIASGAVEQYLNDNSVPLFFRNRIINGDMRIDQRNAGASSNVANATATYFVDRFRVFENTAANVSVQQSTTAPTGFSNSLFVNVFTANATVFDNQIATIEQRIEGFNVSDLQWGTAQAKSVTLSFFVRSNLTGTFGGAIRNNDDNRSYPFEYTINSANTFQQVFLTVPGDTSGTWLSNASTGVKVTWGLAASSNALGTPNAWAASNFQSATGQTNLLANVNNNFYLTGVQLEVGSVATPFERRPYGTELSLCQRYFAKTFDHDVAPGTASSSGAMFTISTSAGISQTTWCLPVEMRDNPTITVYNSGTGGTGTWVDGGAGNRTVSAVGIGTRNVSFQSLTVAASSTLTGQAIASAEL